MSSSKKTIEVSSESFPLNIRLSLKKTFIPFLLFVAVCILLASNFFATWWLILGVFLGVFILAILNYYYMKVFYYRLEDSYLLIKRHAINPQEIIIEYDRIKDIVVHRDTLDRLFGLYEIRFVLDLTSPSAQKMAHIEGLDEVEAHEFRVIIDHLIEKSRQPRASVR